MGAGAGVKVLVVEDYDDARELYAEFLRFRGFEVLEARDGEQALAMVREHSPDVVVLDIALPKLDGFSVLRALRQDPRTAKTMVLTMSASVGPDYVDQALASGATRVVVKPCLPDELVEAIQALVEARRTLAQ